MVNRSLVFLLGLALLLPFSGFQPAGLIDRLDWLPGTWECQTEKGTLFESWIRSGKSEFSGTSFMVREQDTLVLERISLVERSDSLCYIPTVPGQNNGMPVLFTMSRISEEEVVFENPAHDFPQTITYTRLGKDSLTATISGTQHGEFRAIGYRMRRMHTDR